MSGAVCVTGGAGFIGSHVVDRLVADGREVVILDDLSTGLRENVNTAARFVEGSVQNSEDIRRAFLGCEVVFHLASRVSVQESIENPALYHDITALGTKMVIEQAPGRVVLASSCSVYGDQPVPISEDAPFAPLSPYAQAKADAESFCDGEDAVALRFFNVYGPRQRADSPYSGVIAKFLADSAQPTIYGDGLQTRDFVHVNDVVDAMLLAECSAPGTFNIGTGIETNLIELAKALGCGEPIFAPARDGEVRRSCAETTRARNVLGFEAKVRLS